MKIDVVNEGLSATVTPHGPLDARGGRALQDALQRLAAGDFDDVCLDLSAVPIASGLGVVALSQALVPLSARSRVTLLGLRPSVRRLLELAGLLRLMELRSAEAIA